MTFDDDYIQIVLPNGEIVRQTCQKLGIAWPPPEFIQIDGPLSMAPRFRRVRFSQISDEQRDGMDRVCRGAEYVYVGEGKRTSHQGSIQ